MTPKIKLPTYEKLLSSAQKKVSPNYAKDILGALSDEQGPKNESINHKINGYRGTFSQSSAASSAGDCDAKVACDLHYSLDWDYRIRATMTCQEARENDPCFATNACFCSNGFYQVTSEMPTLRGEYEGLSKVFNTF